ncbi:hypothetical protein BGY98DRAFT_934955 [Russula aff. rugulosa BPL654]|nr:hypothetical protein BGY98DRAFT_934955 [Russula aff. rugulosa BPL654]
MTRQSFWVKTVRETREFIFTCSTPQARAAFLLGLALGRSAFDVGLFPLRFRISLVVFAGVTMSGTLLGGDELHGVDGLHPASVWDVHVGPEDDDERGGGGTECEAYHSGSDNTWTARIRSHAVWAIIGAQIPCIFVDTGSVVASKTLRVIPTVFKGRYFL